MDNRIRYLRYLFCGLLLAGTAAQAQRVPATAASVAPTAAHQPDTKKLSYAIGYQIGSQFADGKPAVDIPTLEKAIRDAYANRHPAVSMAEMHRQLDLLNEQMRSEAMTEFRRVAASNERKSAAYMAHNRKQPGVVQLPSGIQYSVITKGAGASPKATSTVIINYRGMLIDGTEFDSTWAHGAPVSFTVDKVIPGWRDVIPRMHVGDRWRVVIPPELAYGEQGALPRIGPNEALVFEIELLAIKADGSH